MRRTAKKIMLLVLAVLISVSAVPFSPSAAVVVWDGQVATSFQSGSGSENDPYIISTPGQLAYLAKTVNESVWYIDKHFKLGADIYINDPESFIWDGNSKVTGVKNSNNMNVWTPIGAPKMGSDEPVVFVAGSFDGAGHKVSGLYINSDENFRGLFGAVFCDIKNLEITGSYIKGGETVGGIAARSDYRIENCKSTTSMIIGKTQVGGIVGVKREGEVELCSNTSSVQIQFGSADPVRNERTVGGIVGTLTAESPYVKGSKNTGRITGNNSVSAGGIVGKLEGTKVESCYNLAVISNAQYAGGIVGKGVGEITRCYNAGANASGIGSVYGGGIVGYLWGNDTVLSHCYNTMPIKAMTAGSIIGRNYSVTVKNCYTLTLPSSDDGNGYSPTSGEVTESSMESNNYFVTSNTVSNVPSGNIRRSPTEMKNVVMISLLNNGDAGTWKADTELKNNGYPILEGFTYEEEPDPDPVPNPTKSFKDVSSNAWYYNCVTYVVAQGYFTGVGGERFAPRSLMTREMFVTVLGRMAEMQGEKTDGYVCGFTDVKKGTEYAKYIGWANKVGIVKGITSTKFGMKQAVTRQEAAAFISRYARYVDDGLVPKQPIDISQYTDQNKMSKWAKDDIEAVLSAGVFTGYRSKNTEGKYEWTFQPRKQIDRAEAAQVVYNYFQ